MIRRTRSRFNFADSNGENRTNERQCRVKITIISAAPQESVMYAFLKMNNRIQVIVDGLETIPNRWRAHALDVNAFVMRKSFNIQNWVTFRYDWCTFLFVPHTRTHISICQTQSTTVYFVNIINYDLIIFHFLFARSKIFIFAINFRSGAKIHIFVHNCLNF